MGYLPAELNSHLIGLIMDQMMCFMISDAEGRYLYANRAWEKLMHLNFSEVRGRRIVDVVKDSKVNVALSQRRTLTAHSTINVNGVDQDAYSVYSPIIEDDRVVAGAVITILSAEDKREYIQQIEKLLDEMKYYKTELNHIRGAKYSIDNIVGQSPAMIELKEAIRYAARSRSTVMIEAETGCGKELVGHAIHNLSSRASEPFVKVNCASIPSELLESEFFGYNEGAFTGAKRGGFIGKFEQANKGSLFLDEVEQLSMPLQPKFLRVLQEGEIERLGGNKSIPIDVRIIAATNVSIEDMVKRGEFRSDLYYRLNVLKIVVPPLRDRLEDIPLLVDSLVEELNSQLGMHVPRVSDNIKDMLMDYNWPGNVRELRNSLERAMNVSYGSELLPVHFQGYIDSRHKLASGVAFKEMMADSEKLTLLKTLRSCKNKSEAAKKLGYSRTTLYKKIKEYGIEL